MFHQNENLFKTTLLHASVHKRNIYISYSMVLQIKRADILLIARIFLSPEGVRKNTSNEQNVSAYILYIHAKPSNKRFIIPLQKDFVILVFLFWKEC